MSVVDDDGIRGLVMGDRELLVNLIDLFKSETRPVLSEIVEAIESDDVGKTERLVHRIHGEFRNFFAAEAVVVASSIEAEARRGNLAVVRARLPELEEKFDEVAKALDGLLTRF